MEALVNTSLKNSALVLAIVTLLYVAISELKMTERMRIMLVYIFAGFLGFAGSFQLRYVCIGAIVVPLLVLEFLSEDIKRQQLFTRLDYKILDFMYRMFIEYAYAYFVLALMFLFISHRWHYIMVVQVTMFVLALLSLVMSLVALSAEKYATKSITDIVARLERGVPAYQLDAVPNLQLFSNILIGLEDRSYFARKQRQHTLPLLRFITKGFSYVRSHRSLGLIKAAWSLFGRGYGTIEMQLLRSVGIEYGYQYTIRRKLFELLYANMLFNGYYKYLKHSRGDYYRFRELIILKYIENVDVSINGHKYRPDGDDSSLSSMFAKPIAQVSREEFFIWCLGLPQRPIGRWTLDYYAPLMARCMINRTNVEQLLARFN